VPLAGALPLSGFMECEGSILIRFSRDWHYSGTGIAKQKVALKR
jgi:hypothetical protein